MTKTIEVVDRLDRIIELLEVMESDEIKTLEKKVSDLHDWQITCVAEKTTHSKMIQFIRFAGPWVVAFMFILFEHKLKVL